MRKSSLLKTIKAAGSYRWVSIWLALAALFALLLLANSMHDYFFVARILAAQQVRHQLTRQMAAFEHDLAQTSTSDEANAELLVAEVTKVFNQAVWIVLRDPDGRVIAQKGIQERQVFTHDQTIDHFRNREALFDVVPTSNGEAVVEVFPLYLRPTSPGPAQAHTGRQDPIVVSTEVAMPLTNANASALWPIRRNLLINAAASFALLLTVTLTALGFRRYVRGRKLELQLELGRQVQANLFPKVIPVDGATGVAVAYQPADEVGGDFYDVFQTEHGLALVVGDVSGKGLPAALLVGVMHGAVRSSKWWESAASHERESAALNRLLCEETSDDRFVTMFWSCCDSETLTVRYVNAGHCPPLLVGLRDGRPRVQHLDVGGPVLGVVSDAIYTQGSADVHPGDLIVLYSDGLVEATNPEGEQFGESRVTALLLELVGETPETIRDRILSEVRNFLLDKAPQDDLTCVVGKLDWRPAAPGTSGIGERTNNQYLLH